MYSCIVILGAPNDDCGNLSEIAKSRSLLALQCIQAIGVDRTRIVLTGGFGPHFNTSGAPHTQHVARFLETQGISSDLIDAELHSGNTAADIILLSEYLAQTKIRYTSIEVVTSDFHVARVRYLISNSSMKGLNLEFHGATAVLENDILERLVRHETQALKNLSCGAK